MTEGKVNEKRYRCLLCHKRVLKKPVISLAEGKGVISGEMLFHWYDTHGIPPELGAEMFQNFFLRLRGLISQGIYPVWGKA